jgi:hypothetical protein
MKNRSVSTILAILLISPQVWAHPSDAAIPLRAASAIDPAPITNEQMAMLSREFRHIFMIEWEKKAHQIYQVLDSAKKPAQRISKMMEDTSLAAVKEWLPEAQDSAVRLATYFNENYSQGLSPYAVADEFKKAAGNSALFKEIKAIVKDPAAITMEMDKKAIVVSLTEQAFRQIGMRISDALSHRVLRYAFKTLGIVGTVGGTLALTAATSKASTEADAPWTDKALDLGKRTLKSVAALDQLEDLTSYTNDLTVVISCIDPAYRSSHKLQCDSLKDDSAAAAPAPSNRELNTKTSAPHSRAIAQVTKIETIH